ncbi:MAG: hypothetical protein EOP45_01275 [Sphingobacteriaceae bacterium]|nr:MAG: hypothetical protein EOP45_01275 [Sphingobacteriaceae bacterium]
MYGEDGFQTSPASYHLSYQWLGGKLRLKEFIRLKSDQELEEAAAKVKQKEQNAREEK